MGMSARRGGPTGPLLRQTQDFFGPPGFQIPGKASGAGYDHPGR
jgi:hypothetical protein